MKADRQRQATVLPEIFICPDEEYEVLLLDEKFPENTRISSGLLGKKLYIRC